MPPEGQHRGRLKASGSYLGSMHAKALFKGKIAQTIRYDVAWERDSYDDLPGVRLADGVAQPLCCPDYVGENRKSRAMLRFAERHARVPERGMVRLPEANKYTTGESFKAPASEESWGSVTTVDGGDPGGFRSWLCGLDRGRGQLLVYHEQMSKHFDSFEQLLVGVRDPSSDGGMLSAVDSAVFEALNVARTAHRLLLARSLVDMHGGLSVESDSAVNWKRGPAIRAHSTPSASDFWW